MKQPQPQTMRQAVAQSVIFWIVLLDLNLAAFVTNYESV